MDTIKNAGDIVAGSAVAASWMEYISGPLELTALVLAVVYGVFRLYEMQTTQNLIKRLRSKLFGS